LNKSVFSLDLNTERVSQLGCFFIRQMTTARCTLQMQMTPRPKPRHIRLYTVTLYSISTQVHMGVDHRVDRGTSPYFLK